MGTVDAKTQVIKNVFITLTITIEVCVQTTMREANDRGYGGLLVEDATARYFPEFKRSPWR